MVEGLQYKAAGNDMINLMKTKDTDIELSDVLDIAQKYKLSEDKMGKLIQMMDTSGALKAAREERKYQAKERAAKEALVDKTGLPSDAAIDVLKANAKTDTKPPTVHTFTEGDQTVEKQWNDKTQMWEEVSRGPRYKPANGGGGNGFNSYNLTPEQNDALSRAIDNGLDPYKINSRTAKIYAQQEITNPGRKWNELGAQAGYERSVTATNTKTLLNSLDPLFDELIVAGSKLSNTRWPLMNKPINWVKEHVQGNEDIVAFNNLRDDTVAEVERGLLGTGVLSDEKYRRAIKNINSAQTPQQLAAAVANTKIVVRARLEAVARGPNPPAKKNSGVTPKQPGGRFKILKVE